MKKILLFLVSALVFSCVLPVNAIGKEYHFYIKRGQNHIPPTTDIAFDGIWGEDCCYRDINAAKNNEKKIYLTFDAGYENGNVQKILDVLKKENVPGAFFVLSHLINSAPAVVARMREEGHLVCNHTARHKNMAQRTKEEFARELLDLEKVYQEAAGQTIAKFYRPPEGSFSLENIAWASEMGYKTVFWSLAYCDWNDSVAPSVDKAIQILKDNTHPGAIVLLHPTSAINVTVLSQMISYWRAEGYTFGALQELL